jgi:hypothetical protein
MTGTPRSVPTSEADVTLEWLHSALAPHFPAGAPALAGTERIGQGYGLSSVLLRCRLLGPGGPRSVVVKLWPTDGPAGSREVPFYATFGCSLGIRVPRCHHGAIDEESKRGVLVLEDLEHAVQGDCLHQLDGRGAAALAEVIAALHATWWERPGLDTADWLPIVAGR